MNKRSTADVTVYVNRFIPRTKKNDPLHSVTIDVVSSMHTLEQQVSHYLLKHFPLVDVSVMMINESPPPGTFWIDVRSDDHHLCIQLEVILAWFDWNSDSWRIMVDSAVIHHYRHASGKNIRIRTWHHPRFSWSAIDIDQQYGIVKNCVDRFDAYYQARKRSETLLCQG